MSPRKNDSSILPDTPTELKHTAYWGAVAGGGLILQLLILMLLAGSN